MLAIKDIEIINGRYLDKSYEYDFHTFFDKKTIRLVLLLPGINADSVQLIIKEEIMTVKAMIKKEYFQIFKSREIEISGQLPVIVREDVFVTEYRDGMLIIELVREFDEPVSYV